VLRLAVEQKDLPTDLYTNRDDIWLHYWVHSQHWANSQEELAYQLQQQMQLAYEKLTQAKFLCITLGTAWVYNLLQNPLSFGEGKGEATVANCHKQPASLFDKRLLRVEEIVASFRALQASLEAVNPDIRYILTVSPVRHLKDTLELNAVGKAVLRLATYELSASSPKVDYFPAYELLMDDLRDYRFYAPDLLHPNEVGEQYIWEKFSATFFRPETTQLLQKIHKVQASLAHRPLQQNETYQNFLLTLQTAIEALPTYLDFEAEKQTLAQHLTHNNA
jgi:transcription termination factor NusB